MSPFWLPHTLRLMLVVLLCVTLFAINVSSAPIYVGTEVSAAIEAVKTAGHWAVEPRFVPSLARPPSSALERVKSLLKLGPIKAQHTAEGVVRVANMGSSPRLIRFGSKNKAFVLAPKATETFRDLSEWQRQALVVHRVPPSQRIHYNERR